MLTAKSDSFSSTVFFLPASVHFPAEWETVTWGAPVSAGDRCWPAQSQIKKVRIATSIRISVLHGFAESLQLIEERLGNGPVQFHRHIPGDGAAESADLACVLDDLLGSE